MRTLTLALAAVAVTILGTAAPARAFCGFYVSGAGGELYNDATQVVMMRKGTRTVLSMQNAYQGPPEDFALVVPVPVVLQKKDVKTLPPAVFDKIDQLAAPRLVEYWEQDPCAPQVDYETFAGVPGPPQPARARGARKAEDLGVTIEAQFEVGEYQIVILSAVDSAGLDTWLRQEKYQIPEGAEKYLRPYVESGSKFFVAKVDVSKVKFDDGRAILSPLRFHYDSEEFSLPIRLGLMNAQEAQDLIVHILSPGQRYEVANMKNVTIPTNIDVEDATRERFGAFYATLFDRTLEVNRGAVVTEYAWDSGTCDPCPTPPLSAADLMTLGADVIEPMSIGNIRGRFAGPGQGPPGLRRGRRFRRPPSMVLTRLHARYGEEISDDLVFRAAPPIVGGREFMGQDGVLEERSRPGSVNNFQARYAIRHEWEGPIECENPRRGIWGGPPGGRKPKTEAATDLGLTPRGEVTLASFVNTDIPEIRYQAPAPAKTGAAADDDDAPPKPRSESRSRKSGCGCEAAAAPGSAGILLVLVAGMMILLRRRRRRAA